MSMAGATPRDRLPLVLLAISVSLFLVALALPAIQIVGEPFDPGWNLLAVGWLGLPTAVVANLAWLANPVLLCGWVAVAARRRAVARIMAISALIAMSLVFVPPGLAWNEGGMPSPIDHFGAGFWLWLASGVALIGAAFATG